MESFQNKEPDCTLYSKEGFKFRIHKEILFQAEKMRNILISELNGCCHNIEMLCPCDGNELESILKLIYNGKISYRTETEIAKIFENLTKIFGFSENLFSVQNCSNLEKNINEEFEPYCDTSNGTVTSNRILRTSTKSSYFIQNSLMRSSSVSKTSESNMDKNKTQSLMTKSINESSFVCDDNIPMDTESHNSGVRTKVLDDSTMRSDSIQNSFIASKNVSLNSKSTLNKPNSKPDLIQSIDENSFDLDKGTIF